jgi:hypothetical protein
MKIDSDVELGILDFCKRDLTYEDLCHVRLACKKFSMYISFDDLVKASWKKRLPLLLCFIAQFRTFRIRVHIPVLDVNMLLVIEVENMSLVIEVFLFIRVQPFIGPLAEHLTREDLLKSLLKTLSGIHMYNPSICGVSLRGWEGKNSRKLIRVPEINET